MTYEEFKSQVKAFGFDTPNGIDFYTHNGKLGALIYGPKGSLDYSTSISYREETGWTFRDDKQYAIVTGKGETLEEAVTDFNRLMTA